MIRRALLPSFAALALAACAVPPPKSMPQPSVSPTPTPEPAPAPAPHVRDISAARAEFVRSTSQRFGIPAAEIEAVLAKAQLREAIIKAMSRPAEAKPWRDYRPIFIQPKRIDDGRAFLAEHRAALQRAEDKYGVPKEIITAILGVETSYGGNKGSYPVIDALYTLAFAYPRSGDPAKAERENKREAFFRDELAQLFALGKEEGFDIATLKGSYAGAMGWGQFMPSSYRDYAVDGDGDGKRDLFNDLDDVFASVANYFVKKGGWVPGAPVAVPATLAAGHEPFNPEDWRPTWSLEELAARGYSAQQPLPAGLGATPVSLEGAAGPQYWLGFQNYYAITRYNISRMYAMAVYQLSQAIAGHGIPPA